MKIVIDLEKCDAYDGNTVAELIREEIKDAVRREVKRLLRDKQHDLAKAVERSARAAAKSLEDKLIGLE